MAKKKCPLLVNHNCTQGMHVCPKVWRRVVRYITCKPRREGEKARWQYVLHSGILGRSYPDAHYAHLLRPAMTGIEHSEGEMLCSDQPQKHERHKGLSKCGLNSTANAVHALVRSTKEKNPAINLG